MLQLMNFTGDGPCAWVSFNRVTMTSIPRFAVRLFGLTITLQTALLCY